MSYTICFDLVFFGQTNWEINGIHKDYRPSSANICSRAPVYSEKIGTRSRLKFQLLMNLSFLVPDALSFVPNDVFRGIVETVKNDIETILFRTKN